MLKKFVKLLAAVLALVAVSTAAFGSAADPRSVILLNGHTNAGRNRYLKEDFDFLAKQLPKLHKNPFSVITRQEFEERVEQLKLRTDTLDNIPLFAELGKLLADIGDAHTGVNFWDGFSYPLVFDCFDGDLYVINADKKYEELLYAKVTAVNGHETAYVAERLKELIPHENESWLLASLPDYFAPVYMFGLGLIPDEVSTRFAFETADGEAVEKEIAVLNFREAVDYCVTYEAERNFHVYDPQNEPFYWYEYLGGDGCMYFKYNVCAEMEDLKLAELSGALFEELEDKEASKLIIDLRHNTGGNSEIIQPFISDLKKYAGQHGELQVYVIIGRLTFSSGVMAALDLRAALEVTLVGEATGGSPNSYGEVNTLELPNSKLPIRYSVKYFQLTDDGAQTLSPDVEITPGIDDFMANNDVVVNFILER